MFVRFGIFLYLCKQNKLKIIYNNEEIISISINDDDNVIKGMG